MKFVDRERELELLKKVYNGAGTRSVVIRGMRRIGKTRLVLESAKDRKLAYIFVPRGMAKQEFLETICSELGIPGFTKLEDVLDYISREREIIFMDEFQNFLYLDKSAYSVIQKMYDRFQRANRDVTFVFSGSSRRLMNSVFTNYSKELFGRVDLVLDLKEIPIQGTWEMMDEIRVKKMEDRIAFWSMWGGIPRFYDFMERLRIRSLDEFIDLLDVSLPEVYNEGREILRAEFGGDFPMYLSIITLILKGKNRLSEIASYLGNNPSLASRYLYLLEKESGIVTRERPIFKGKKSLYKVQLNFLNFWGRVILPNDFMIESNKIEEAILSVKSRLNQYFGFGFEEFSRQLLAQGLAGDFVKVGRQWGRIPGAPKGQNTYEIDIVGIPREGPVVFGEAKWREDLDAREMARDLMERVRLVPYEGEYEIWLFGKSFKRKIRSHEGVRVRCVDLRKIERVIRR